MTMTSNGMEQQHDPGPGPGPGAGAGGGGGASGGLDGGLSGNVTDVINQLSGLGKNGIIVNAVLVWIDIQMRGTPDNCWKVEAEMRFTDRQITESRTLLWNIARVRSDKIGEVKGYMDAEGKIHGRKGDKKVSESLSDIQKLVIKLQELHLMPILLGTSDSIACLPPFNTSPKETNVSDVLNRMMTMENTLNSFIKQQSDQMKLLSSSVSNIEKSNSNNSDQDQSQHRRVNSLVKEHENFPRISRSPKRRLVEVEPSNNVEIVKQNSAGNWASIAAGGKSGQQSVNNFENRPQVARRAAPLLYGNARAGADNTEQFLAADVQLAAYGVSKDATEDQLKQFIVSKGIAVTDVTKLTTFAGARTNTFKVCIKASDYDKALKPEVWPLRVGVRLFRPKRTDNQGQSWSQQSASSGGNVQTQPGSTQSFGGARGKVGGKGFPFQAPAPLTPVNTSNMFSLLGDMEDHGQN